MTVIIFIQPISCFSSENQSLARRNYGCKYEKTQQVADQQTEAWVKPKPKHASIRQSAECRINHDP